MQGHWELGFLVLDLLYLRSPKEKKQHKKQQTPWHTLCKRLRYRSMLFVSAINSQGTLTMNVDEIL